MPLIYDEGKENALNRLLKVVGEDTADTTLFFIPFERNDQFTGRESQLDELEGKLFVDAHTKVAITGTSGIGKTQLALELAYRTKQKYKCSVFWIPAIDMESLHQTYEHIAQ
jgi:Cdc6-like AAA superfamily ATPase